MEKKFRQTIYIFKFITPSKRFNSFSFTELSWDQVAFGYCNKSEILKIEGDYYLYSGELNLDLTEKLKSHIMFRKNGVTTKVIEM
jgi:hypothetical protein